MFKYYHQLQHNQLFQSFLLTELETIITCGLSRQASYHKGETILLNGSQVTEIGIVLNGKVNIIGEDYQGNAHLLGTLGINGIFAETLACARAISPVRVIAQEDSEILWLKLQQLLTPCQQACGFHTKLIENMMYLLASKNLMLNQKIEILAQRTIREQILTYLRIIQRQAKTKYFLIPFSRQALADYLGVDRSALSRELSKMQNEGLISYRKNQFCLMKGE